MNRRNDDDLIGEAAPVFLPRSVGRPRSDDLTAPSAQAGFRFVKMVQQKAKERTAQNASYGPLTVTDDDEDDYSMEIGSVLTGVSVTWLGRAFEMPRAQVEKRIKGVRAAGVARAGNPLYRLRDVAGRLVDVEFNLEEFLKNVKDDDLPESLRLKFWQARRQRQKFEEDEGMLWRTEKVLEVFGEILMALREKIQQLPDRVERLTGMTTEQYRLMRSGTDEIMDDLHETVLGFAAKDRTRVGMAPRIRDDEDLL